jgi:GTP cyclohydrolase FolE2
MGSIWSTTINMELPVVIQLMETSVLVKMAFHYFCHGTSLAKQISRGHIKIVNEVVSRGNRQYVRICIQLTTLCPHNV